MPPGPFHRPSPRRQRPGLDRFAREKPTKVIREPVRAGVALEGVLVETLQANRFQVGRDGWLEALGRYRIVVEHLQNGIERRFTQEWGPAGQEFVKNGSQR